MPSKVCPDCKESFEYPEDKKPCYCKPCVRARNVAYYARDPEGERARAAKHRAENPEMHKAATQAWRENNAERFKEIKRVYRASNEDHVRQYRREYHIKTKERANALAREWKAANRAQAVALGRKRKAAKIRAVPPWFDSKKANEMYAEARRMTEETGIPHHVDHIVPLQSNLVCGLHWHGNLQVLPAPINWTKSNRHCPDTPLAIGM